MRIESIELVVLIIGLVLLALGAMGRAVGDRKHYYCPHHSTGSSSKQTHTHLPDTAGNERAVRGAPSGAVHSKDRVHPDL